MLKENKGITLIALVITIIVLLILAGVSIAMIVGDNGILTKAGDAKEENQKGEVNTAIAMAVTEVLTKYYAGDIEETGITIANIVTAANNYSDYSFTAETDKIVVKNGTATITELTVKNAGKVNISVSKMS